MSNFKSSFEGVPTFGSAVFGVSTYLLRITIIACVSFAALWFGWTLLGCGLLKSFFGFWLILSGGGYFLWHVFGFLEFPFSFFCIVTVEPLFAFIPPLGRLVFVVHSILAYIAAIVAIFFFARFIINVCPNDIDYQNKIVFGSENPKDFKIYSNFRNVTKDLKSNKVNIRDWLIIFKHDTKKPKYQMIKAKPFLDQAQRHSEVALWRSSTVDSIFEDGYRCCTFPDAHYSSDVFDRVSDIYLDFIASGCIPD